MFPATNPNASVQYQLRRQFELRMGSYFRVFDASGKLAFYAHQKGFRLKEDIRVYADEAQRQEVFRIAARSVLDLGATYDVIDSTTGQKVGALRRQALKSMIQDEWAILDPADNQIGRMFEDTLVMALLRRFLSNLIPQNYDVELNGQKVADFRQPFHFFGYQLNLDFSLDSQNRLDRRLGIAGAILLAAIEGKQEG
jgi:hypothetical protein